MREPPFPSLDTGLRRYDEMEEPTNLGQHLMIETGERGSDSGAGSA